MVVIAWDAKSSWVSECGGGGMSVSQKKSLLSDKNTQS